MRSSTRSADNIQLMPTCLDKVLSQKWLLSIFCLFVAACVTGSDEVAITTEEVVDFSYEERVSIPTIDDRELIYFVDRPLVDQKVPILLSIDGSSCIGQLRPVFRNSPFKPGPDMFDKVIKAVSANGQPKEDEDTIIIMSANSEEETIGIRALVAKYQKSKTIVNIALYL